MLELPEDEKLVADLIYTWGWVVNTVKAALLLHRNRQYSEETVGNATSQLPEALVNRILGL